MNLMHRYNEIKDNPQQSADTLNLWADINYG